VVASGCRNLQRQKENRREANQWKKTLLHEEVKGGGSARGGGELPYVKTDRVEVAKKHK